VTPGVLSRRRSPGGRGSRSSFCTRRVWFPSARRRQLTCWGGNVRAFKVQGDFDACQRLVKQAFVDPDLQTRRRLTSANSISLGRLLPQMVYYAAASLEYRRRHHTSPGFVIPSGNVGNATACLWARRLGLPIREVVLATNANPTLTRFVDDGIWEPGATIPTLATAMDVGNPSNMERLFALYGGRMEAREALRASLVTDAEIRDQIRTAPARWGQVWDPHTATGFAVRDRLDKPDWIVVATAHPAKFEGVVEPLTGTTIEVPPGLAELLDRPSHVVEIGPGYDEFVLALG
jgi:threonine synthase